MNAAKLNGVFVDPTTGERWFTIKAWANHQGYPSEAGLRGILFNSEKLSFEGCVRRIGRRVLISETRFGEWIAKRSCQ